MKNWKMLIVAALAAGMVIPAGAQQPTIEELTKSIDALTKLVENQRKRIDELEKLKQDVPKLKEATEKLEKDSKAKAKTYLEAKNKDKIKVDGRAFLSFVDAEKDGTNGGTFAFQLPDGRLRFTYSPSDNVEGILRLRLAQDGLLKDLSGKDPDKKDAAIPIDTGYVDYFYLDFKNLFKGADTTLRLGRLKADIGEETWTDNPVESILINNSVPILAGYDEGVQIFGTTKGTTPLRYSAGLINDSTGTGSSKGTAGFLKLSGNLDKKKKVYLSGSYFLTDDMPKDTKTEVKIGGLNSAPAGAAEWSRDLWEIDATYNYQGGSAPYGGFGKRGAFGGRVSYGQFGDDAKGGGTDRDGNYWHVEGLVNLNEDTYFAARYSNLGLDGGMTDTIAGVKGVNDYGRLQFGFGHRLSPLTVAKIEYMTDNEDPVDANNDTLTVGVATKF